MRMSVCRYVLVCVREIEREREKGGRVREWKARGGVKQRGIEAIVKIDGLAADFNLVDW